MSNFGNVWNPREHYKKDSCCYPPHRLWQFYYRFYRQFFQFSLYFLLSVICFTLRPGPPSAESIQNTTEIPEINDVTSGKYKYTADRGDDRRRKRYSNNSETSTQLIENYITNNESSTSLFHEIFYTTQTPPAEKNIIYNNTINFRLFNQTSFSEVCLNARDTQSKSRKPSQCN